MSSLKTKFLKLNKWIGNDYLKRDEMVENFDKIDIAFESTNASLEQNQSQIKDILASIDETQPINEQLATIVNPANVKINTSHIMQSVLTAVKDKTLIGKGEIAKKSSATKVENFFVDVKNNYNVFTGKVNKFNSYDVLKPFTAKAKLGTVKVGVIGDSIGTSSGKNLKISYDTFTPMDSFSFTPNGLTETDSFFYRMIESLTQAFKNTVFDVWNYSVGGTNLTQYNDEKTYNSVTKPWIDFVKDQNVDLIVINFGMNHNTYALASVTKYYLNLLLDYIATWTNPPVVIVATSPRPVMDMSNAEYGIGSAQFARHSTAHTIRNVAEKRGCYVLDNNHLFNCLKDGIDFERIYMVRDTPIITTAGIDNGDGSYTLANGQSLNINNGIKDFVLEFDLDVTNVLSCIATDILDIRLGQALDLANTNIMNSRTFIFPNKSSLCTIDNYGNISDSVHYPTVTKTGTAGRSSKMSIRIEKRGNEFNIYKNRIKIIRDRLTCVDVAGYIQLKCSIVSSCTISNIKLYKAKYVQYMPLLTDTECYGEYNVADATTRTYAGGNGLNHPTTLLIEYVYNETLRELENDLKIASI